MKKQLLKYILFIGVVLVCFTSCEFDNPYDTEINKPELYINADIQKDSEGAYFFLGNMAPKSLVEKSITLENTGAGNLIINSVSYTGSGVFKLVSPTSLVDSIIAPGESLDIIISFLPLNVTDYTGVLTIDSNSNTGEFAGSYELNIVASGIENVYQGDLVLTSQAAIDAFSYTAVTGNLHIKDGTNSITNLDGLEPLTTVGGFVDIEINPRLIDISGLENLSSIGSYFYLGFNPLLENIVGLEGLVYAPGYFYILNNAKLASIAPLSNLETIEYKCYINNNNSLTSLEGLDKLSSVGASFTVSAKNVTSESSDKKEDLSHKQRIQIEKESFKESSSVLQKSLASDSDVLIIEDNTSLNNYCSLNTLFTNNTNFDYSIIGNEYNPTKAQILTNECSNSANVFSGDLNITTQAEIDAFDYTEVTGQLAVTGSNITNLDGLSSLTEVGTDLLVYVLPNITNLNGLSNVTTLNGLQIATNLNLTDISGLSKISSLDYLYLINNSKLTNLVGLENLETLSAGNLFISGNSLLTDLTAFSSLTSITGDFTIQNNSELENFCVFKDLFTNNGVSATYDVSGNKYNPTKQQIIDNDCDGASAPVVYNGNLSLTTQAQVDAFAYTEVTGTLTVTGAAITNLDGLSSLTKVKGSYLNISNTNVENLDGLSNVAETMGLYVQSNANLIDISGLTKITNSIYLYIYNNDKLTSLEGLNNLETVTNSGLIIDNNAILEDISALSKLTNVTGSNFRIRNNPVLEDFCVFKDLFTNNGVSATYDVSGNKYNPTVAQIKTEDCKPSTVYNGNLSLTTQAQVDAFAYTEVTGYVSISGSNITNLNGLSNLTKTGTYLQINSVSNLASLDGLGNLTEVGQLYIQSNANLTDISALSKITIATYLVIDNNSKIASLSGLDNLASITTHHLLIRNNPLLSDVSALNSLTSVAGQFQIQNNSELENFCAFTNLFKNNGSTGTYSVSGNKYNPTKQQIIDEDCDGAFAPVVYNGNLSLTTQAQVDAFTYTEVTGYVNIQGSNITNLDGLSSLTKVKGSYLNITSTNVENLDGLSNVAETMGLYLQSNANLIDISGLLKITNSTYLVIISNDKLTSLEGLNNLETVTNSGLRIENNALLEDVSALSRLSSVSGTYFRVVNNTVLEDFCVFKGLFTANNMTASQTSISGNKYNPTVAQIKTEDCKPEVAQNTVTDIDGNVYKTVTIGTQTWMAENLKVTRTSNGTAISNVTDNTAWANLGNNLGYSFYNNDANQSDGAFYNYSAASVACPQGWRLPSSGDINTLNSFITSQGLSPSTALRATSFSNGTDDYGFSANLTNYRSTNGGFATNPNSILWSQNGYYWVYPNNNNISTAQITNSYGFCVRCVKE